MLPSSSLWTPGKHRELRNQTLCLHLVSDAKSKHVKHPKIKAHSKLLQPVSESPKRWGLEFVSTTLARIACPSLYSFSGWLASWRKAWKADQTCAFPIHEMASGRYCFKLTLGSVIMARSSTVPLIRGSVVTSNNFLFGLNWSRNTKLFNLSFYDRRDNLRDYVQDEIKQYNVSNLPLIQSM